MALSLILMIAAVMIVAAGMGLQLRRLGQDPPNARLLAELISRLLK